MGNWLNQQVALSVGKWALTGLAVVLVAKGWISDEQGPQLISLGLGAITLVVGIISAQQKKVAIDVVKAVDAAPGVDVVKDPVTAKPVVVVKKPTTAEMVSGKRDN